MPGIHRLVIQLNSYAVSFTYGDGHTQHFINQLRVEAVGKCFHDPFSGAATNLTFFTRNGEEPEPNDEKWFVPGAPGLGTISGANILDVQIPLPRGAMQSLLEVLKDPRPKSIEVECTGLEEFSDGWFKAVLKQFTISTSD